MNTGLGACAVELSADGFGPTSCAADLCARCNIAATSYSNWWLLAWRESLRQSVKATTVRPPNTSSICMRSEYSWKEVHNNLPSDSRRRKVLDGDEHRRRGDRTMVTVEGFSRLVRELYDAALRPDFWVDAIRDIHESLGGVGGMLLAGDGADRAVPSATTLPDEAGKTYAEYYCLLDHEVRCMQQGPVGVVRSSGDLMAPARSVEFYSEWMRPLDLEDGLFVRLTTGPSPICLVVGFPRPMGHLGQPERVKVLTGLVPHLQQALQTQARLGEVVERGEHLVKALELHRHGIVVVGPELLVLETNPAADRMLAMQMDCCSNMDGLRRNVLATRTDCTARPTSP